MARQKSDTNRAPADENVQQGPNLDKMEGNINQYRETPPAPVAGSKEDRGKKSRPDRLHGPLHDEEERSGTEMDQ